MFTHVRPRYSINHLIDLFDIGRARLYDDINSKKLDTYTIGKRRFASPEAVDRYNKICEQEAR